MYLTNDSSGEKIDEARQPENNGYGLRNRDTIQKPRWYDQFQLFVAEGQEPSTYTEAVHSQKAEAWKKKWTL